MEEVKRYLKIAILTSTISYLISSFIAWDLFWIKDVGKWDIENRILMFLIYLIITGINLLIMLSDFLKPKD
jgi:hypothetical protein